MDYSKIWAMYGITNERLAGSDTNEVDRQYHEQERQRAEDRARHEREWEDKQRRDAEDRRYREEQARRDEDARRRSSRW